jgi:hypothetical protein
MLRVIYVKSNPLFIAKDIATILGYKDTDKVVRDHVNNKDKITYDKVKDICEKNEYKIQSKTILIYKRGLISLLTYCKKYDENLLLTLKKTYDINFDVIKRLSKEEEYIKYILQCFEGEEMIRQYSTKSNFMIDLYFPKYKISVECDEFGHSDRNIDYETNREQTIIKELDCVFIRFNPDDKDFNIFSIINSIYKKIRSVE